MTATASLSAWTTCTRMMTRPQVQRPEAMRNAPCSVVSGLTTQDSGCVLKSLRNLKRAKEAVSEPESSLHLERLSVCYK